MKCDSLMTLIAVVIACEIYFGDNMDEYQKVKEKLGVKNDITFEEDEEYSKNYVYMNWNDMTINSLNIVVNLLCVYLSKHSCANSIVFIFLIY